MNLISRNSKFNDDEDESDEDESDEDENDCELLREKLFQLILLLRGFDV